MTWNLHPQIWDGTSDLRASVGWCFLQSLYKPWNKQFFGDHCVIPILSKQTRTGFFRHSHNVCELAKKQRVLVKERRVSIKKIKYQILPEQLNQRTSRNPFRICFDGMRHCSQQVTLRVAVFYGTPRGSNMTQRSSHFHHRQKQYEPCQNNSTWHHHTHNQYCSSEQHKTKQIKEEAEVPGVQDTDNGIANTANNRNSSSK